MTLCVYWCAFRFTRCLSCLRSFTVICRCMMFRGLTLILFCVTSLVCVVLIVFVGLAWCLYVNVVKHLCFVCMTCEFGGFVRLMFVTVILRLLLGCVGG